MKSVLSCFIALIVLASGFIGAQEPFESFKKLVVSPAADVNVPSTKDPAQWRLSAKTEGTAVADGTLELVGNGQSGQWTSKNFPVEPLKLYRFQVDGRVVKNGSGLCTPCGLSFAGYDYSSLDTDEQMQTLRPFYVFSNRTTTSTSVRLGQWASNRTFRFGNVKVSPASVVYTGIKSNESSEGSLAGDYLLLGDGETIDGNAYRFTSLSSAEATNFDRPLHSSSVWFNTSRWCFSENGDVVYRFRLQPVRLGENPGEVLPPVIPFVEGEITIGLCHYVCGRCILEVSLDGENWKELGSTESLSSVRAKITSDTFGKEGKINEFFVRIRAAKAGNKPGASFQVSNVTAEMKVDSQKYSGRGKTLFTSPGKENNKGIDAVPLFLSTRNQFVYALANRSDRSIDPRMGISVKIDGQTRTANPSEWEFEAFPLAGRFSSSNVASGASGLLACRYNSMQAEKEHEFHFAFGRDLSFSFEIPLYLEQNYTNKVVGLKGHTDGVTLSWCAPDYKVPRNPQSVSYLPAKPIRMESARNDFESLQLVVCPNASKGQKITGLTGSVSDLIGPAGAKIAAENIELRYAYYHFVNNPTDRTSIVGYWPDALVPLAKGSDGHGTPIAIQPGCNQPVWVTVHVSSETPAGTYRGSVTLKDTSGTFNVSIPYELKVWDIVIPAKNSLATAFGLSEGTIARYQNLKTPEDRRAVWEMYLECFGAHRISLYTPAPFDSLKVKWNLNTTPPTVQIDGEAFAAEMKRIFAKYHFTNFRCRIEGLGGGTYESRYAPAIGKFNNETPEYKALMSEYGRQLQKILKDAGLLDAAYAYWFDEPEPKDYEFVANGFATLKKYMPGIARMLTEEPNDQLNDQLEKLHGELDIWCPVSNNFDEEQAAKRMSKNERFWWYVCCGPKAPYCTLFIDHPATELRVWLWQTWQRGIVGNLVWASNYWTSPAAYPDKAQNPYEDPMGYVSSGPKGSKRFWGNGDGRFVYPPLAAAEPGLNNGKPILEKPVSSIRFEMLREGIEDYELLAKLKKLADKAGDKLDPALKKRIESLYDFSPITTKATVFTKVPAPIYQKRREMLQLIVELQKKGL